MRAFDWKRLIAMLLAVLMSLSCFVACDNGNQDDPKKDNPDTPGTSDGGEDDGDVYNYLMDLPEEDWGDETFCFLVSNTEGSIAEQYITEEAAEAEDVDAVTQAIYERNNIVEEYKGVQIDYIAQPGSWANRNEFMQYIRSSVKMGTGEDFSAASIYMAYSGEMAVEGLFYDLLTIDTLNPQNPWWAESYVENNTVYDRLYMIAGDVSISVWKAIFVCYFNKQIAADNGLNDLYKWAEDGEWTWDLLMTCAELVSDDFNGDEVYDEKDVYGLLTNLFALRSLVTSFAIPQATRTEDGGYELSFYSRRTETIYADIYEDLWMGNAIFDNPGGGGETELTTPIFMEDRALFTLQSLNYATTNLRSMETAFGVLPSPKYDSLQTDYRAHVMDTHSIIALPNNVYDPDFCGSILEALGAESKHSVVPAYYDVVLRGRTTRDDESDFMLDLIRESLYFDFGYSHCTVLGEIVSIFGGSLHATSDGKTGKNPSLQTVYDRRDVELTTKMETAMDQYRNGD